MRNLKGLELLTVYSFIKTSCYGYKLMSEKFQPPQWSAV